MTDAERHELARQLQTYSAAGRLAHVEVVQMLEAAEAHGVIFHLPEVEPPEDAK